MKDIIVFIEHTLTKRNIVFAQTASIDCAIAFDMHLANCVTPTAYTKRLETKTERQGMWMCNSNIQGRWRQSTSYF